MGTNIVLLPMGVSGCGKGTLIESLQKNDNCFIVEAPTASTREKRTPDEKIITIGYGEMKAAHENGETLNFIDAQKENVNGVSYALISQIIMDAVNESLAKAGDAINNGDALYGWAFGINPNQFFEIQSGWKKFIATKTQEERDVNQSIFVPVFLNTPEELADDFIKRRVTTRAINSLVSNHNLNIRLKHTLTNFLNNKSVPLHLFQELEKAIPGGASKIKESIKKDICARQKHGKTIIEDMQALRDKLDWYIEVDATGTDGPDPTPHKIASEVLQEIQKHIPKQVTKTRRLYL